MGIYSVNTKRKIYHASPKSKLSNIEAKISYSYKELGPVVFGSLSKSFAAVFGSGLRDDKLNISTENSKDLGNMKIILTLKDKNAKINEPFSLYEIQDHGFIRLPEKKNDKELVCNIDCNVIKEYRYKDWYLYMKTFKNIEFVGFPETVVNEARDIIILNEASDKPERKYKCPYCDLRDTRVNLVYHISEEHEEMIPEGFTSSRIVFNYVNKKECGRCIQCGGETKWNDKVWKYERICSDKCNKEYVKIVKARMVNVHGKEHMLDDPEQQKKMLSNRKISGEYKFKDGGIRSYCGSYEMKLLEFYDKVLGVPSKDIICPGPIVEYTFNGKKHKWITDIYYVPANLVHDVKDGGDNPNNRQMDDYRAKQIAKEKAIEKLGQYNYMRLTDNNFQQLILILMELKENMMDNKDKFITRINEGSILESEIGVDYLPNGKKDLSKSKRLDMNNTNISALKKECKSLKHIRTGSDYKGYIYVDISNNSSLIGFINVNTSTKTIQALEVDKWYRGFGLSEQLLDVAVSELGADNLSVNKKNEIAIHLYNNNGFITYNEDTTMYYMKLRSSNINEGSATAGALANTNSTDNTYVVPYYMNNTFIGTAMATDKYMENIYFIKDSKVTKGKVTDLNECEFVMYKYKGTDVEYKIESILAEMESPKEVSDDFFYTELSGKIMLSSDQIEYDELFEEATDGYTESIICKGIMNESLTHQYRELKGENIYVPLIENGDISNMSSLVFNYDNISILSDMDGYFAYNHVSNTRTPSYSDMEDLIPSLPYLDNAKI